MAEPRIPMLSIEEARRVAAEVGVAEELAPLSVFRVLLRQPAVAKRIADLLLTLLREASFDARLRELVIMRIGWVTGSVYEWTQHWRIARLLGVSDEDLLAVRDWRAHDHWSEADRAILAATDETLEDGAISAETWQACRRVLPEAGTQIELVISIGNWRMFSQLLRSLEIPLEDGVAAWPPDGARP